MTELRNTVKTFKALSDPNRIRILKMLEYRALCVCEITEVLQLATSTVSKHLSILREAGFIIDEKDGRWVNYRLEESTTNRYAQTIQTIMEEWVNNDEVIQQDLGKLESVDRYVICES